jgi:hypothetical protein
VSAESFLSSVVEVAIGMGGFAGIVAAIRQRDISRWPRQQRLLLQMLFAASAAAIAFALLPTLLAEAELSPPTLWRVGSGSLVIWFASIGAFRFNQARRNAVPFPFRGLFVAWTAFLILLQALNLVLAVSWPYLIGVFGILVNGFIFFLRLLLGDLEGQDVDA